MLVKIISVPITITVIRVGFSLNVPTAEVRYVLVFSSCYPVTSASIPLGSSRLDQFFELALLLQQLLNQTLFSTTP